eukprot:4368103-Pyramimonas_sp.AAC.1
MAPVCSSFTFANSAMTRRANKAPEGDCTYAPARDGNHMVLQPCVISAWDYLGSRASAAAR